MTANQLKQGIRKSTVAHLHKFAQIHFFKAVLRFYIYQALTDISMHYLTDCQKKKEKRNSTGNCTFPDMLKQSIGHMAVVGEQNHAPLVCVLLN